MRRLCPAFRGPVVHCPDERGRTGTHRFQNRNTAYRATILRDLPEKNDGWKVENRELHSGSTLSFTMRVKGGGIARLVPAGK